MNMKIHVYKLVDKQVISQELYQILSSYTHNNCQIYNNTPAKNLELYVWSLDGELTWTQKKGLLTKLLPIVRTEGLAIYLREQESEPIRRIVADLDGCLVAEELLPRLSKGKSYEDVINRMTQDAMSGIEGFGDNFARRVTYFQGLPATELERIAWEVKLARGIELFCQMTEGEEIRLDIASSNLVPYVHHLAQRLGATDYIATMPELDEEELLTGELVQPIIKADEKRSFAEQPIGGVYRPQNTLTIGDGANDIEMLSSSSHSLLYSSVGLESLNLAHVFMDLYFRIV